MAPLGGENDVKKLHFLHEQGKQNVTFSHYFTLPGLYLLDHPCISRARALLFPIFLVELTGNQINGLHCG